MSLYVATSEISYHVSIADKLFDRAFSNKTTNRKSVVFKVIVALGVGLAYHDKIINQLIKAHHFTKKW